MVVATWSCLGEGLLWHLLHNYKTLKPMWFKEGNDITNNPPSRMHFSIWQDQKLILFEWPYTSGGKVNSEVSLDFCNVHHCRYYFIECITTTSLRLTLQMPCIALVKIILKVDFLSICRTESDCFDTTVLVEPLIKDTFNKTCLFNSLGPTLIFHIIIACVASYCNQR